MDLVLYHGDHRRDERGYPQQAEGTAEKIQQAIIRLTVPKGRFALDPELGSRLYELGTGNREPGRLQELALEYAQEALSLHRHQKYAIRLFLWINRLLYRTLI